MRGVWVVFLGAWAGYGAAVAGASCAPPGEGQARAAQVVVEDAGPPPPACVREVCAQRPGWLACESGPGGGYCSKFRITYEHHCDCAAWAPAARDGGAP